MLGLRIIFIFNGGSYGNQKRYVNSLRTTSFHALNTNANTFRQPPSESTSSICAYPLIYYVAYSYDEISNTDYVPSVYMMALIKTNAKQQRC